ncbi:hypothetical protein DFP83_102330 [Idiomarina fontislapidosi]|jgi:hypothetical protein|nr:hypothetical protein [Idiomarina fontislapidosi]PYE34584.1 hypothetical protein DFP83_102330 [Idiomarina fontislapidosi]|tara:strand:- start:392 stop:514 length:123 start_codon:yes stop_codon:yes gene_type:complete
MMISETALYLLVTGALLLTVLAPIVLIGLFLKDYFSKSIW